MQRVRLESIDVARALAASAMLHVLCFLPGGGACAKPIAYSIDPDHTHPSFEVDHYGMSMWRGLFRHTTGSVLLDAEAGTGSVDISVDIGSVDLGQDALTHTVADSSAPPILESGKYPNAHYVGTLGGFLNGVPKTVDGALTLHGITRPLTLTIVKFRCLPDHPVLHREVCGADAIASFNRADFGITVGQRYGFNMDVTLRIQVEAIRDPAAVPRHD